MRAPSERVVSSLCNLSVVRRIQATVIFMRRFRLSKLMARVLLIAVMPIALGDHDRIPAIAQLELDPRDYTRGEIQTMMAEMPDGFIYCGTGLRWLGFLNEKRHTPSTVATIREIFEVSESPKYRRLALAALAGEPDRSLRALWIGLLDATDPEPDQVATAVRGLSTVGTNADLRRLVGRLGRDAETDVALLKAFGDRRLPEARPAALQLFRNEDVDSSVSFNAFRCLLAIDGRPRLRLLREGARNRSVLIRGLTAETLKELTVQDARPLLSQLMHDPEPRVRRRALLSLNRRLTLADLPLAVSAVGDADELVRLATEDVILAGVRWNYLQPPNPRLEALIELGSSPDSPIHRSPRLLQVLARAADIRGDWPRAMKLYRQAAVIGLRFAEPRHADTAASAACRYRLAQLLYYLGRDKEARTEAIALRDAYPEHTSAAVELTLGAGSRSASPPGYLADKLLKEFSDAPLRLSIVGEGLASREEGGLLVQLRVENVTFQPVRLSLFKDGRGGWLVANRSEIMAGNRLSVLRTRPAEPKQVDRVLQSKDQILGELLIDTAGAPPGWRLLTVSAKVSVVLADGEQWEGWLHASAPISR